MQESHDVDLQLVCEIILKENIHITGIRRGWCILLAQLYDLSHFSLCPLKYILC